MVWTLLFWVVNKLKCVRKFVPDPVQKQFVYFWHQTFFKSLTVRTRIKVNFLHQEIFDLLGLAMKDVSIKTQPFVYIQTYSEFIVFVLLKYFHLTWPTVRFMPIQRLGNIVVKSSLHIREVAGSNPGRVWLILSKQKYLTQSLLGFNLIPLSEE